MPSLGHLMFDMRALTRSLVRNCHRIGHRCAERAQAGLDWQPLNLDTTAALIRYAIRSGLVEA